MKKISSRMMFSYHICDNTHLFVSPFRLNKMMHVIGGACSLYITLTVEMLVPCLLFLCYLILWDAPPLLSVFKNGFPAFTVPTRKTLPISFPPNLCLCLFLRVLSKVMHVIVQVEEGLPGIA